MLSHENTLKQRVFNRYTVAYAWHNMTFLLRIKNAYLIKIQYWDLFLSIKPKQYFKQYLLQISIISILLIRLMKRYEFQQSAPHQFQASK